jgi:hypothetical protein
LSVLPVRVGIPVAKIRLFSAAVTALGFGALLYLAVPGPYGFTLERGLFLLYGVTMGSFLGWYEAKLVLSQINQRTFRWLWRIPVVTGILVLAPFMLVVAFFGVSEGAGFMVYAVLPAIPTFLGLSGYQYNRFEKEKSVQIYSGPFGFEYWIQPVVGNSKKFYLFIRDLQVKDTSALWPNRLRQKYQKELGSAKTFQLKQEKNYTTFWYV